MSYSAESKRLDEIKTGSKKWNKWGPYLSERQWGTVREDYSPNGTAWEYFPHDDARSRVYRWGEDGLAGISDNMQRMCFALCLWNKKDPILKERLYGLTGNEGNHGEDVKELYYYLDNTPSHAYMKHLYKYPQTMFPYEDLKRGNRARSRFEPEFELQDTGIFDKNKYFDVFTEYAKHDVEDICIRITIHNRGDADAEICVLPTLWFRNLWSFGIEPEKPSIQYVKGKDTSFSQVEAKHHALGTYQFYFQQPDRLLFTENETNKERIFKLPFSTPYVKDAFHVAVTQNNFSIFDNHTKGTKFAPYYDCTVKAGASVVLQLRLSKNAVKKPFGPDFEQVFTDRIAEADAFYDQISAPSNAEDKMIQRQAFAGMLWGKQYYNIDIPRWLHGDPGQPPPPESRKKGRNHKWHSLNNEDIITMPDKWEYPWYAAWDVAFHCVPLARIDSEFAKKQMILFLREWYMHPNGQIPAYEWAFGDVNPPVHAWGALEVFKIDREKTGVPDHQFLEKVFHKLLINFTWWVNRKDHNDNNVFEGGFLGLDNIGVFDRSSEIPGGGFLEQADGTAWMAMYSLNMLEIALELSQFNIAYEDVATKFFEHFVYISDSLNGIAKDWVGAWDEKEGFFYDVLAKPDGSYLPVKIRSLVGLTSLFAVLVIPKETLDKVPIFHARLRWFAKYRKNENQYDMLIDPAHGGDILLSLVPEDRLKRIMKPLLDEKEFLAPGGIRSLSKIHTKPYELNINGKKFGLNYQPAESTSPLFGGNSNWRGPVWFPMNYLLILSLQKFCGYYGTHCLVPFPTHTNNIVSLEQVSIELTNRLIGMFKKDQNGHRPVNDHHHLYKDDPYFEDLILFYEYFHGDNSRGMGASHQTGWTGLVAELIYRSQKHPFIP
ncbi:MAG: hypothetical protein RIR11_2982 [Bacteroidota bacterium]|jgi:hypothetical protein